MGEKGAGAAGEGVGAGKGAWIASEGVVAGAGSAGARKKSHTKIVLLFLRGVLPPLLALPLLASLLLPLLWPLFQPLLFPPPARRLLRPLLLRARYRAQPQNLCLMSLRSMMRSMMSLQLSKLTGHGLGRMSVIFLGGALIAGGAN